MQWLQLSSPTRRAAQEPARGSWLGSPWSLDSDRSRPNRIVKELTDEGWNHNTVIHKLSDNDTRTRRYHKPNRVYDPSETAREGISNQLSATLKSDFLISAGFQFQYGSSYNEFSRLNDDGECDAKKVNEERDIRRDLRVRTALEPISYIRQTSFFSFLQDNTLATREHSLRHSSGKK
ncbi:uncharacterized protein B0T15DRAFT_509078 [Chaetomium strumarium]|uniref:Uncharacterized protein n=1 Tax=Chaetomium strumarium TaxID=1170767 RepID=A0AAJ0GYR6_9PEZI|nr:hypothetical protein B0T15DRAFT_509078 [Chaetomium strumarium]